MPDDGHMRLPRIRRPDLADPREAWMTTASKYASHLTESGSRCHLNDGSVRFCHWAAEELRLDDPPDGLSVGVRCTIHPGGRYLDSSARLDPEDFAPTGD